MIVTYLDLKTGLSAKDRGISVHALTEGNWSCDCNRRLAFNKDDWGNLDICDGEVRFIVINVEEESEKNLGFSGYTKEKILANANAGYWERVERLKDKEVDANMWI